MEVSLLPKPNPSLPPFLLPSLPPSLPSSLPSSSLSSPSASSSSSASSLFSTLTPASDTAGTKSEGGGGGDFQGAPWPDEVGREGWREEEGFGVKGGFFTKRN